MRGISRDILERAEAVVRLIGTINLVPQDWARAQRQLDEVENAIQFADEARLTEACGALKNLIPTAFRGMTKVWEQRSREERSSRVSKGPAPADIQLLFNKVKHSLGTRLDELEVRDSSNKIGTGARSSND